MIRRAEHADISQIKALWEICFPGDSAEDREFFFTRLFQPEYAWIYEENGRLIAMLHALPYTIRVNEDRFPARYFYGIGTAPDMRRRGLAAALLRHALAAAEREDALCCFLVPASAQLAEYYQRHGFSPLCQRQRPFDAERRGRAASLGDIPHLQAVYERALANRPHPIRTERDWENLFCEVREVCITERGYLIYDRTGALCETFGCDVPLQAPQDYALFYMLRREISMKNGYFNLLHD